MTLSQIAELFNKEKYNVCKSLKELDASLLKDIEIIEDFKGGVTEAYIPERPALMLVTGFTGEKADRLRLACVDAFIAVRDLQTKAASNPLAIAAASGDMVAFAQLFLETTKAKAEAERLARYSQRALATSQQNTAGQTRKTHKLENQLAQRERKISLVQWFAVQGIFPRKHINCYTAKVKELLIGEGFEPEKILLEGDKYPNNVWPKYAFDDNADRIRNIVAVVEG
jgi:phage regulator Rha-like protein